MQTQPKEAIFKTPNSFDRCKAQWLFNQWVLSIYKDGEFVVWGLSNANADADCSEIFNSVFSEEFDLI